MRHFGKHGRDKMDWKSTINVPSRHLGRHPVWPKDKSPHLSINMQLLNLLVLALASSVSATDDAQDAAVNTGVSVYQHINYQGSYYPIPLLNSCVPLPPNLARQASSILFRTSSVSCALFGNQFCGIPALITGLQRSVPDLHILGLGDRVASMRCVAINKDL
ncbi:hypothetical protein A9K55_006380 [Cordyceps militaris]|uniref:Uncharacterized protein n=1 Tax=Cordyceps militaris TaxID=73501 RepID=A0A2H4SCL8_CORMI|nr:hypothetical protein A9K55_006380 [Cordyceps militaris]